MLGKHDTAALVVPRIAELSVPQSASSGLPSRQICIRAFQSEYVAYTLVLVVETVEFLAVMPLDSPYVIGSVADGIASGIVTSQFRNLRARKSKNMFFYLIRVQ